MNLRSRLSTIIAARVVLVTLLMGTAILIQINRPGSFPIDPFFALIGLTYALSVFYLATLRFVERHLWLIDLQFGVDALLVSAFIHVTGGIASNFSSLYLLPIIAAFLLGVFLWAVPLLLTLGGPSEYVRLLSTVAMDDVRGVEMLATSFSPRLVLAALGICLVAGAPLVYPWLLLACLVPLPLLQLRRERLARRALHGAA